MKKFLLAVVGSTIFIVGLHILLWQISGGDFDLMGSLIAGIIQIPSMFGG